LGAASNLNNSAAPNSNTNSISSSRFLSSSAGSQECATDTASTAADVLVAAGSGIPDLGFFAAGAAALDALHTATGLPWCAVIPAAAVAIKTLLLPISLKQAKIVRTNMVLWKEAYEFQKQQQARMDRQQQEQQQQQQQQQEEAQSMQQPQQSAQKLQLKGPAAPAGGGQGAFDAAAAALQQLQHWQQRIQLFHDLRRKCTVPHPAWFFVNSSLQVCAGQMKLNIGWFVGSVACASPREAVVNNIKVCRLQKMHVSMKPQQIFHQARLLATHPCLSTSYCSRPPPRIPPPPC
jgi:hypothetical protein